MNLTRIFEKDYIKAYGPQAALTGVAVGLGTYAMGTRMTYRELQDIVDDVATLAIFDNLKDLFKAAAGAESKYTEMGALLIPIMGKLGNTVATFVVPVPAGSTDNDVIAGNAIIYASIAAGLLSAAGVYITADGIAATLNDISTKSPRRLGA